ncbi:endo-1,4-beta-xylanase [Streptomyces sp. Ru73]|uniref:endo-1,4-beta-xylanase n=1 Tax=Streptomyces sp. Ru73 TaxID=2080748 RepID=UPI0015E32007|nr:endo-1,4-beta-xylanase [Streptomyces sp. Ru73]
MTLSELAARHGLVFGTALTERGLADPRYRALAATQFSSVTPENAMKWDHVERERHTRTWAAADAIARFAARHGQEVRGHPLVWYDQLPPWLTGGHFTPGELTTLLRTHVTTLARRYAGTVTAWDVVNEPLADDGCLRRSIWHEALGPDHIAQALTWAHAADPGARLYLNEFNTLEENPKSKALYDLAGSLLDRGVPLHGIGFQCHLLLGQEMPAVARTLNRFAELGLEVAVTELSVRMLPPVTPAKLAAQAAAYRAVVEQCLAAPACTGLTVWGVGDADSWVPQGSRSPYGHPTLHDEDYRPKPAREAVARALAATPRGLGERSRHVGRAHGPALIRTTDHVPPPPGPARAPAP